MKAITAKIDALIKAHVALQVVRSFPSGVMTRGQFMVRPEAEVARCQADLTATLDAIFYPAN